MTDKGTKEGITKRVSLLMESCGKVVLNNHIGLDKLAAHARIDAHDSLDNLINFMIYAATNEASDKD